MYSLNITKEYQFLQIITISIFEKFVSLMGEINISFVLIYILLINSEIEHFNVFICHLIPPHVSCMNIFSGHFFFVVILSFLLESSESI